ncbi:MAG: DUF2062 domain-containing protein [Alphaproteobacteria bacterium]
MLFKPRKKPHPVLFLRNLFWPKSGWKRASRYIFHRVGRLPATPYSIAAGFACGAAISFTPFIGFHFASAALISWLIGGNLLASAIGTVVGNPWTFPFIWFWTYEFGSWILQHNPEQGAPEKLSLELIFDHPDWLLWPMTVGGIPTAIIVWLAFYWPIKGIVASYQHHRHRRREEGKARRAMRKTTRQDTKSDE